MTRGAGCVFPHSHGVASLAKPGAVTLAVVVLALLAFLVVTPAVVVAVAVAYAPSAPCAVTLAVAAVVAKPTDLRMWSAYQLPLEDTVSATPYPYHPAGRWSYSGLPILRRGSSWGSARRRSLRAFDLPSRNFIMPT